jgi:hypothetical protein
MIIKAKRSLFKPAIVIPNEVRDLNNCNTRAK